MEAEEMSPCIVRDITVLSLKKASKQVLSMLMRKSHLHAVGHGRRRKKS